jgi:hypothetical protein
MRPPMALCLLTAVLVSLALGQQSDFATKQGYESRYASISARVDSAKSTGALDSLRDEIRAFELAYTPQAGFLDKALYPTTFAESIEQLKKLHALTYDRVYLIQTQGIRLVDLEARVASLTARLDSLTANRDQLFGELQESKKSVAALRDVVKRLTANLQAKDKLIFALVDSIFLPYGKDVHQVADVQKEAIGRKLDKANVVTRVYEIASDNVRFLDMTQLQGKDYASLFEQHQAFSNRWIGLRDKLAAVAATSANLPGGETPSPVPGTGKPPSSSPQRRPAATAAPTVTAQTTHVDSVMNEWNHKLLASFWAAIQKDLTNTGVGTFNDGPSFSNAIRTQAASLKSGSQDPGPFVETVWKGKIDKEWREALQRDEILGRSEYAALDRVVSELNKPVFDYMLLVYAAGVLCVAWLVWFLGFRKPKPAASPKQAA